MSKEGEVERIVYLYYYTKLVEQVNLSDSV